MVGNSRDPILCGPHQAGQSPLGRSAGHVWQPHSIAYTSLSYRIMTELAHNESSQNHCWCLPMIYFMQQGSSTFKTNFQTWVDCGKIEGLCLLYISNRTGTQHEPPKSSQVSPHNILYATRRFNKQSWFLSTSRQWEHQETPSPSALATELAYNKSSKNHFKCLPMVYWVHQVNLKIWFMGASEQWQHTCNSGALDRLGTHTHPKPQNSEK
jgi:hypothetical protein